MKKTFLLSLVLLSLFSCTSAAKKVVPPKEPKAPSYAEHPAAIEFIQMMVEKEGFPEKELQAQFGKIHQNKEVLRLMSPAVVPESQKNWARYRTRFLGAFLTNAGASFWQANEETVTRASKTYGVSPEIIVAIIGVETGFGRNTGTFGVLESLATLAFDYPPRSPYFLGELRQFLIYARDNKMDPLTMKGSYAGASGIPQFMPTSLLNFAVDFDGDGKIDVKNSVADAIGSVANYFAVHQWQTDEPVAIMAQLAEQKKGETDKPNLLPPVTAKPSVSLKTFREAGVIFNAENEERLATLIDLASPNQATEYWLGFHNFYVITRYNRANFYAMAVFQLGNAIKEVKEEKAAQKAAE